MAVKQIALADGTRRFFGRRRPLAVAPRMKMKNYILKSLPSPPPACGYMAKAQTAVHRMYMNASLGCHDAATEVLTERGWQLWPEYDGSLVGTMNRFTGLLEFQLPTTLYRCDYDGPMHFADHKSMDFGLTPEHRMLNRPYVIARHDGRYVPGASAYSEKFQFDKISELKGRTSIPEATTGFLGTELRSCRIGNRVWDGDDLVKLLALILSDGYVSNADGHRNDVSFCCFREDRYDMVATFAKWLQINEQPSRRGVWKFSDADLSAWIKSNCYIGAEYRSQFKRIPDLVKVVDADQASQFLAYFGDQHIGKDKSRQFYSSSRKMIDDLQEILLHVGRRGGIYSRPQRDGGYSIRGRQITAKEGHLDITLTEWSDSHNGVTILPRGRKANMAVDHYKGEVFCATVPNSTLITRRNGQILISGNCCVEAEIGHSIGVLTCNAGDGFIFTNEQIIAMYSAMGGYVPGDPATDQGTDIGTALNIWQQSGAPAGSHRITGSLAIDATNPEECRTAIWLFENLMLGLELPDAWVAPFPSANGFTWDVAGPPDPSNGHCIGAYNYNSAAGNIGIVTWGMTGFMTDAALAEYCSPTAGGELYTVLSQDSINAAQQKAPNGFDFSQLLADFDSFGA